MSTPVRVPGEGVAQCLDTVRLMLLPWTDAYLAGYQQLVSERGQGTPTARDVAERIDRQRTAYATTGICLSPIHRRLDEQFLGYCGLNVGRASLDEPELAYELVRRAHGLGYATVESRDPIPPNGPTDGARPGTVIADHAVQRPTRAVKG